MPECSLWCWIPAFASLAMPVGTKQTPTSAPQQHALDLTCDPEMHSSAWQIARKRACNPVMGGRPMREGAEPASEQALPQCKSNSARRGPIAQMFCQKVKKLEHFWFFLWSSNVRTLGLRVRLSVYSATQRCQPDKSTGWRLVGSGTKSSK